MQLSARPMTPAIHENELASPEGKRIDIAGFKPAGPALGESVEQQKRPAGSNDFVGNRHEVPRYGLSGAALALESVGGSHGETPECQRLPTARGYGAARTAIRSGCRGAWLHIEPRLWPGFEDEVEGRLGGAAEARKTCRGDDVAQPCFTSLSAKTKPHFLAE
jgi:hypothetical protein